jgi:hypothetical protein
MEQTYVEIRDLITGLAGLKVLIDNKRYKPGVGFSCKAKDVGLNCYAECLEIDANSCPFSFSYGSGYYCTSPVRTFIAKGLKKPTKTPY